MKCQYYGGNKNFKVLMLIKINKTLLDEINSEMFNKCL